MTYSRLREHCLCTELREKYPQWPFPLLFHGKEISRDIFFLGPVLEWGPLDLGRNPVQDAAFLKYKSLNQWFHYQFFCGLNSVVNSAEAITLLPRIFRLRRVLLDNSESQTLEEFLRREFSVESPQQLIDKWIGVLSQITEIAAKQTLIVWGLRINDDAYREHLQYVETVSLIRMDLALNLPHLSGLRMKWEETLKSERKAYRRTEALYNKQKKLERRVHSGPVDKH